MLPILTKIVKAQLNLSFCLRLENTVPVNQTVLGIFESLRTKQATS